MVAVAVSVEGVGTRCSLLLGRRPRSHRTIRPTIGLSTTDGRVRIGMIRLPCGAVSSGVRTGWAIRGQPVSQLTSRYAESAHSHTDTFESRRQDPRRGDHSQRPVEGTTSMTDVRDLGAVAARYWWVLLVRGILLIALGIMMISWPEATLVVLLVLFGAYLIVDGVLYLGEGMAERRAGRSSGGFFVQGVLAVVVGIAVIVWPEAAASVGIWVLAFWAILAGIAGIAGGLGSVSYTHLRAH